MGKIIVGAVIVVAIVAFFAMRGNHATAPSSSDTMKASSEMSESMTKSEGKDDMAKSMFSDQDDVKEFSMTSYYDAEGKWFSLKEMSVKKGDKVRVKVTNTKGTHDFTIDEYGIKKMTPLNEEVVVEFTADKAGEFAYYCSVPGHRAGGQWGTLKVTE